MELAKLHYRDFMGLPTTEVSHFLVDDNQLVVCCGVNPSYKKGRLLKDTGYSKIGSVIESGKSFTGLHDFRQSPTVKRMLATINNSGNTALQLFSSSGGAWTEITQAETDWLGYEDARVEMEDFIGHCFFVGYDAIDDVFLPNRTLTGSTFATTNTTSMPGAKLVKRYRNRLYLGNCYNAAAQTYRVYFSSVPSAGTITWDTSLNFFDVDFSEQITGLESVWDRLFVFTEFSTYMYNQDENKKAWDVGCINNRTIQSYGTRLVFADASNIWYSENGANPQPMGNSILELLRNGLANSASWSASIIDREYSIYLGNTSANGTSYANCLATFSFETGQWRWRELANAVAVVAKYTNSTGISFLWLGSTAGVVYQKSKYTDSVPVWGDDGVAVSAVWRTKAYDMGDPSIQKQVVGIMAYAETGQNMKLRYRVYDSNQEVVMPFTDAGAMQNIVQFFPANVKGHFIQFEGREFSKLKGFSFDGFTIQVEKDTDMRQSRDRSQGVAV